MQMTGAPVNESCAAGWTKTGCVGSEVYQKINCLLYFMIFILKTERYRAFK